jgi:AmiR/NasT family two-component response regulator
MNSRWVAARSRWVAASSRSPARPSASVSRESRLPELLDRVRNLEAALATNRRIGMAVGILMSSLKVTDTEAFDLMRVVSQRTNRRVRAVADEVIDTGTLDRTEPHM